MFTRYLFKKYFLVLKNYFQLMGTNILTTRKKKYFYKQKINHNEQIIMYNEQNIKHHEHLIVYTK